MDMLRMTLSAMGLEPDSLLDQAARLGQVFEQLGRSQAELLRRTEAIQASLDMIAGVMGLAVPPPDPETLALIETESLRHVSAHGGLVDVP